jgi:hypothetical protein
MPNKKRILIIENDQMAIRLTRDLIYKSFKPGTLDILPYMDDIDSEGKQNIFNWNFIWRRARESQKNDFHWLTEAIGIDIYIIDKCLIDNYDDTGIDIVNYLFEKGKRNLVLLTSDPLVLTKHPYLESRCLVLNKQEHDDKRKLTDYIAEKTLLLPLYHNEGAIKAFFTDCWSALTSGLWYNNLVDKTISFLLRVLVFGALVYGIANVSYRFYVVGNELFQEDKIEKLDNPKKTAKDNDEKKQVHVANVNTLTVIDSTKTPDNIPEVTELVEDQNSKQNSMHLLALAEIVFLSFLPFFIIFSFLGYYNSYLKYIWSGANIAQADQDKSTASLRFSKALFISSIVATVIIKIIEKISHTGFKLLELIPFGILLVLLMLYYLYLEKEKHHATEKEKDDSKG